MTLKYIDTVIKAIEEASKEIMRIYALDFDVEIKSDQSPVTIADKTSSKILLKHISEFNIPIISEEEIKPEYDNRKNHPLLWLIDPLDGTKEFIAKNDQFCICIALVENNKPILGFIASPTKQTIMFGGKDIKPREIPFGTDDKLDDKWLINYSKNKEKKVLAHSNTGFSGTTLKFVRNLEKQFGEVDLIKKGSALKFIDLVKGYADFYVRLAPTMEWDIAAGQAIYESIGGEVIHFNEKTPLNYNKPQLKNPYFLAKLKTTKLDNNE